MAETNIPKFNIDDIAHGYAFPISSYVSVSNRVKNTLYECKKDIIDAYDENIFKKESNENKDVTYVKIKTDVNGKYLIAPVYSSNPLIYDEVKTEDQDIKIVTMNIFDRELNCEFNPTAFFTSDGEVYLNQQDAHILSMYSANSIKGFIATAVKEKALDYQRKYN